MSSWEPEYKISYMPPRLKKYEVCCTLGIYMIDSSVLYLHFCFFFFELFDKFMVMINAVKIEFINATEYYS